jgi:hypothetical protein
MANPTKSVQVLLMLVFQRRRFVGVYHQFNELIIELFLVLSVEEIIDLRVR